MTDAARLVTHFYFENLEAVRVYSTVFVGNMGSRRVLEKCGFALDGTLRRHALKREEWLEEWFFSLLRPEWESNRKWYLPNQANLVQPPTRPSQSSASKRPLPPPCALTLSGPL